MELRIKCGKRSSEHVFKTALFKRNVIPHTILQSWSGMPMIPSIPHHWPCWVMLLGSLIQQHLDGFNFFCLCSRKEKLKIEICLHNVLPHACHKFISKKCIISCFLKCNRTHRSSSRRCLPWIHSSFRISIFLVSALPIIFFKWLFLRLSKIFFLDMFWV